MDKQKEFDYIVEFIKQSEDLCSPLAATQFHALWIAFCLHYDLIVDTHEYDRYVKILADAIQSNGTSNYSETEFEAFYNAISQYLV